MNIEDYPFTIRHLSLDDGGGYLIEFPDLPGCMSDGESVDEAYVNGLDAAKCWIEAAIEAGQAVPEPSDTSDKPKMTINSHMHNGNRYQKN